MILINKFNVAPEDAEQLVKAWAADLEKNAFGMPKPPVDPEKKKFRHRCRFVHLSFDVLLKSNC